MRLYVIGDATNDHRFPNKLILFRIDDVSVERAFRVLRHMRLGAIAVTTPHVGGENSTFA